MKEITVESCIDMGGGIRIRCRQMRLVDIGDVSDRGPLSD